MTRENDDEGDVPEDRELTEDEAVKEDEAEVEA